MNDIIITDLSKSFGDKQVLCRFSARIPSGKITCLMGPSGSGKTTLSNILLGLDLPDSGAVTGVPKKCAALFQEDRLCEDLSVLSNLRFAAGRRLSTEKARSLLLSLGLSCGLKTPVSELSGGMKRRVALARALVSDWDFLLLDEPFKGLDEQLHRQCAEVITGQSAGKTVLCITHESSDVELLGAEIIHLDPHVKT